MSCLTRDEIEEDQTSKRPVNKIFKNNSQIITKYINTSEWNCEYKPF